MKFISYLFIFKVYSWVVPSVDSVSAMAIWSFLVCSIGCWYERNLFFALFASVGSLSLRTDIVLSAEVELDRFTLCNRLTEKKWIKTKLFVHIKRSKILLWLWLFNFHIMRLNRMCSFFQTVFLCRRGDRHQCNFFQKKLHSSTW